MAKEKLKPLRLQIELPEGWEPQPAVAGEPVTITYKAAALQISIQHGAAEGKDWSGDDLAGLAVQMGERTSSGKRIASSSGECEMGTFGTAVFAGGEPTYVQTWLLSSGTHAMIVSLADNDSLDADEIVDVVDTVLRLNLV